MPFTPSGDDRDVAPSDGDRFETALAAVIEHARDHGGDVEGTWQPTVEAVGTEEWDVVISRAETDDLPVGDTPDTGGVPERLARCTDCGTVYPVQVEDVELRPIGLDRTCTCGNDEFVTDW